MSLKDKLKFCDEEYTEKLTRELLEIVQQYRNLLLNNSDDEELEKLQIQFNEKSKQIREEILLEKNFIQHTFKDPRDLYSMNEGYYYILEGIEILGECFKNDIKN
jgi:hypothetical protein